jgi:thiamine-phosphate pyrophosphorylase
LSPDRFSADRLRLYLVADPDYTVTDFESMIAGAVHGGVTALQLRAKTWSDRETLAVATWLAQICRDAGVLFVINDRVDLAVASAADGVHLGVDDVPIDVARQLGGPDFVIGYSPESDEQTAASAARGANYLGVGPVFGTATKDDAGSPVGLGTITRRASLAGIPIIGIGGITATNARSVVAAGAVGVAVASAITGATDPEGAAQAIRAEVDGHL